MPFHHDFCFNSDSSLRPCRFGLGRIYLIGTLLAILSVIYDVLKCSLQHYYQKNSLLLTGLETYLDRGINKRTYGHDHKCMESTFFMMKRRLSSILRSHTFATQKTEFAFFVICYNPHILAKI